MDIVKRLRETYPATYAFTKIPHIGYEAADEIERLRPDAELCRRIIDELVRQNNGMTPGWLLDMVPNACGEPGLTEPGKD